MKQFFAILILFLSVSLTGQPRKAAQFFDYALGEMSSGKLEQAETMLLRALEIAPDYRDARLALADLYREMGEFDKSDEQYTILETEYPNDYVILYRYGHMLYEKGDYNRCIDYLSRYIQNESASERGIEKSKKVMANAAFAAEAVKNPVEFDPVNLGDSVNTRWKEYFPAITADGKRLVFTRNQPYSGRWEEDFYYSIVKEEGWRIARTLPGKINTNQNEGAQAISADGNLIFFTGCNRNNGVGSCDIYVSYWTVEGWSDAINLGRPLNTESWDSQPSLSPDGKTLYFVSDRSGGFGGKDIWKSTYQGNQVWSEPENLGEEINTSGNEFTPYIHWDNETFYFASDGHPGMGGYDLFHTKIVDGKFQTPTNFGVPINTQGDESGLVIGPDGRTAYFATDQGEDSRGDLDIYQFQLPKPYRANPIVFVEGNTINQENSAPVITQFVAINLSNGDTVFSQQTGKDGYFYLTLKADENYAFIADAQGFMPFSENYSFNSGTALDPVKQDVELTPIAVGKKVVLNNIFFETGKYDLKTESHYELDEVVRFLSTNPNLRIEIGGHTDNVGSYDDNLKLSQNRAGAVIDYLVAQGIAKSRLVSKGYADTEPVADNATSEGRAQNRRTELKIIQ